MTDACGFDDLNDAGKVTFTQAKAAATIAYLDELLSDLDGDTGRLQEVVALDVPTAEDVTGRVDLDRLSAAASGGHDPEPPDDERSGSDPAAPAVGRLIPREPS